MLKYRFTVRYENGDTYQQNDNDVSLNDPARSCFYDVEQERVVFCLLSGRGHSYGVSLVDGHFEVDGVPFRMHEGELSNFRLIYFRRHTHHFNIGRQELDHQIVYRFGWQATAADGSNVQRVMELD